VLGTLLLVGTSVKEPLQAGTLYDGKPLGAISNAGTPVMHLMGELSAENESIAFGAGVSINAGAPELLRMHGEFDCCIDANAETPGGVPHA
jgi:hypothetical protein